MGTCNRYPYVLVDHQVLFAFPSIITFSVSRTRFPMELEEILQPDSVRSRTFHLFGSKWDPPAQQVAGASENNAGSGVVLKDIIVNLSASVDGRRFRQLHRSSL